jgi:excisionase family DNA binding protein
MMIHWQGGDHTAIEFAKNKTGQHRWTSSEDVVSLIRALARVQPDSGIASILNRLGRHTAHGHTWTESRVRSFRADHQIAVYQEGERLNRGELTLDEAAKVLRVSTETVRRLIARKRLPAMQACAGAPWIIARDDLEGVAGHLPIAKGSAHSRRRQILLPLQ